MLFLCVPLRSLPLQTPPVQWTPALHLDEQSGIAKRLQDFEGYEGLWMGAIGSTRLRVSNCLEYLNAIDRGYAPESTPDMVAEYSFVRDCYLLRDLRAARAAEYSYLPREWPANILSLLPQLLSRVTGPGEEQRANPHPELGWEGRADAHIVSHTGDVWDIQDDEQEFRVEIIARADFNGDGVEDVAVAATSKVNQGSMRQNAYYLFTKCGEHDRLSMITSPQEPYAMTESRCR